MGKMINLDDYKSSPKSRVFSGRDRGESVRIKLNIDAEDTKKENVVITIPPDTISLNSSFFLGLFGESVRKLGSDHFLDKYRFECTDRVMKAVKDGTQRALKTSDPLKFSDEEK
jgi:hypothetical protein